MHPRRKALLLDVVGRRDKSMLAQAGRVAEKRGLTIGEMRRLCDLINQEFLETGIAADFCHTALGLELQAILDEICEPGLRLRRAS
jgi:hypothetical protein